METVLEQQQSQKYSRNHTEICDASHNDRANKNHTSPPGSMHLEVVRDRLLQIWSPSQKPSAVLAETHGDYYLLSRFSTDSMY